ncbi:MAG: hypothetical protein HYW34_03745 [Candidatus Brennerbacteria bacterium]|nr:hypothetical protein [Candidatus Brennerbacteria bacterium]
MLIAKRWVKKWLTAFVVPFIAIIGIYYGWQYLKTPIIPEEFTGSREQISKISRQLVDLTASTNYKIKDINYLETDGHYAAALTLVTKAREENQNAFNQAVELSNQLKAMTESLPKFNSQENRQISQEAISLEMALIVHFINYTKAVEDLLTVLRARFITPTAKYQRDIDIKLSDINSQALLINNLNKQFIEKMAELDTIAN